MFKFLLIGGIASYSSKFLGSRNGVAKYNQTCSDVVAVSFLSKTNCVSVLLTNFSRRKEFSESSKTLVFE